MDGRGRSWRELLRQTADAVGDRQHARWMCEVASGEDGAAISGSAEPGADQAEEGSDGDGAGSGGTGGESGNGSSDDAPAGEED